MSPALDIQRLSKRFGGALALSDVSLSVARGEVHGLLGSNGSGKSTLIKVLAGYHDPEPGAQITLYGAPLPTPVKGAEARRLGLAFVHQDLGLIPSLSVTENLFLGRLATEDDWAINWTAAHDAAAEVFARLGLSLPPEAPVAALSPVQQALLAIARAYETVRAGHADRPGVLVLDEPTPFLPRAGVEQLFGLVRQCTSAGASVIFVSHDIDEVREITDRATILRDGHLIDTLTTARASHGDFVSRIVGGAVGAHRKATPPKAPALVEASVSAPGLGPVSLTVGAGEILGLTGLIGSGFDAVPACLYGAREDATGRIEVDGRALDLSGLTPRDAKGKGVAYLPADRLGQAGVGALSIADNIGLPVLERLLGPFGLTTRRIEENAAERGAAAGVKPNAPALPLAALSGGNAQKALVAKWLQTDPKLLLLDEPTQGVDVGARAAIWEAFETAAARGAAIVIASTDYEQLATICHRVLIFARGQVVAELTGADLTKSTIAEHCLRSMSRAA